MKFLRRIFLYTVLFVIAVSLYANFLHPVFFFSKQPIKWLNATASSSGTKISFKGESSTLRGRLKAPANTNKKLPAIIFCPGSGGQSSYADNYYASFLDTLYEQNFARDSMVFLYFDKRGVGESEGDWYSASFEDRAADVKAAADYLHSLPFIDTNKIIVVGHSQGGWIAQICLAKYPQSFAGAISMAGPTFGVRDQVTNDYTSNFMCRENLSEPDAYIKATNQVRFDFWFTSFFPFQPEWKQLSIIKDFEPADYLKNVKKPLFLMFCENDPLVSPQKSINALDKLYENNVPSNIQVTTIKGAIHPFKLADRCYNGPYNDIPLSMQAKQEIHDWVAEHFMNAGPMISMH
ncbi:alpha/beta hydrolase family protein [Pinibacter aurantiacus]|uniref:Alpha/beta fold hydrolase n=1 Tax=Pinibacter aurantiacus TaxID=2851599 RepID=A0A9E2SCP1_9BACT|nr:alpha/beta fold hydrolase [Pinibacter aurantiacus]MBV4360653.1 alpha/beta fold hydrolase [Pinibacter aurantiacus]